MLYSISPAALRLSYLHLPDAQVISWLFVLLSPEAGSVSWRRFIKSSRLPPAAHADWQINLYPVDLAHANNIQRQQPSPLLDEVAFRKCAMVEAPSALSSRWRSGWMRERPERWRERRGKRRKWQRMSFSFIKHPETCSSVDVLTDFYRHFYRHFLFFQNGGHADVCMQEETFRKELICSVNG